MLGYLRCATGEAMGGCGRFALRADTKSTKDQGAAFAAPENRACNPKGKPSTATENGACRPEGTNLPRPRNAPTGRRRGHCAYISRPVLYVLYVLYVLPRRLRRRRKRNRRCFFASLERPSVVHRLKPIRGRLPPADCQCGFTTKNTKDRKGRKATNLQRLGRRRWGEPCVRARRTSGPGACRAWRASHAMLWGRGADAPWQRRRRTGDAGAHVNARPAQPPSYMSYTSYWSYRVVLWHVADVPGVQGERMGVALPPLPGRGAAPHQSSQPSTPPLS